MKKLFLNFFAVIFVATLFSCSKPKTPADIARKAKVNFGYAVKIGDVLGENGEFTAENFSALVTENMFKWSEIHPTKKLWNFGDMNTVLDFAEQNKMRVRGHTFIWHQGNPSYLSSEKDPEVLRALLEEQITTLM
ncbi:MAG: endo-1,4-beta-xylanase, partial [Treponemataceae bacterium]|nr:endo-1,4-beta-xylanase [Treponemataceae bacterium]